MAQRIERSSPHARRVLQAIAVYGDESTKETITRMVSENTNVEDAMSLVTTAGMVEPRGGAFRISHPLLREVVIATIPNAVRKELHAEAAAICEEKGAAIETRAVHEFQAQNAFQALILLEQVSTGCTQRGDTNGTITALRRGLELARRELFRGELEDPLRAVLIFSRKLGEALTQAGHFTDAEGVLREALDLAGPSGQDRARVLGALAQVSSGRDRRQEAHMYLREALELAFESGAHELLFQLEDLKKSIASA
jgi:serine/threonine-protein kinase